MAVASNTDHYQKKFSLKALDCVPSSPLLREAKKCRRIFLQLSLLTHTFSCPQEEPWATGEGQHLPSQGLGLRPWPFCFIKQTKFFLSIAATCTVPLPTCNHGLQFSALRSPWGGFAVMALSGANQCFQVLSVLLLPSWEFFWPPLSIWGSLTKHQILHGAH